MTSGNQKVIVFLDYFIPGYKAGGILRSVFNQTVYLKEIDFYIITSDHDHTESVPYENIRKNELTKETNYHIYYKSGYHNGFIKIRELLKTVKPSCIYLNNVFSFRYTYLPLLIVKMFHKDVKVLIASNGMLGHGALKHKSVKKKLFLKMIKLSGILKGVNWHVTNEYEKEDVIRVFGFKNNIKIAPYIVESKELFHSKRVKVKNELVLYFLSRINRKKNLLWALNILKEVRSQVLFKIAGPVDDLNYFETCKKVVATLPPNINVEFVESIPHNDLHEQLKKWHFLLLPTEHENFGHVIIEAMSAGCPVIISNNTPWKNLHHKNVGWDLPLNDISSWIAVIEKCSNMEQHEYDKMSKSSTAFACNHIFDPEILDKNKQLFL